MKKKSPPTLLEDPKPHPRAFGFTGQCFCCDRRTDERKSRHKRPMWETVVVDGEVERFDGSRCTFEQPTRVEVTHACAVRFRRNKTFARQACGRKHDSETDRQARQMIGMKIHDKVIAAALRISRHRVSKIRRGLE